jgi:hypothetical protein
MIDTFDLMAFAVFAVLLAAVVVIVVMLGSLPGSIARKRGHPQAAAINVASWLGIATLGLLWPLALIWAFLKPAGAVSLGPAKGSQPIPVSPEEVPPAQVQARLDALETALRELRARDEVRS